MSVLNRSNKTVIGTSIVTVVTIALILFFFLISFGIESIYQINYVVDSVCLVLCLILYLNLYRLGLADLFSPCSIFTLLYTMMFYVTPIYDIVTKEFLWFGVDLFDQGVKSSIYALIGYLAFYIVTRYRFTLGRKNLYVISNDSLKKNEKELCNNSLVFIVIGYGVCLFANIYYLVASGGTSVLYILTLGMIGSTGNSTTADIGAISMLSYALPSFTLLYFEYGRNRVLKVIAFILMFELQVARGFRFFILQIIIMFGSYYFLRNGKKPKWHHLVTLVFIALVPLILMTIFRNALRTGAGMDLSILNGEVIKDAFDAAFWDNLRIYKNYYALVKVVPKSTPYLYGAQMVVYTAIMLIPRAIWSSKPGNPGTVAQNIALGSVAIKAGSAYPALGEYYYDLGVVGIVFWMLVMGLFLRRIEDRYRVRKTSVGDLMVYCTILGNILQFSIRGYMPSNFWMLIFCLLPYWMMKKFFLRRNSGE